jgi:hypothetical protein
MHLALDHDLLVIVQLIQSLNTAFANERCGEPLNTILFAGRAGDQVLFLDDPFSSDRVEVAFRSAHLILDAWRAENGQLTKHTTIRKTRTTALADSQLLTEEITAFFLRDKT